MMMFNVKTNFENQSNINGGCLSEQDLWHITSRNPYFPSLLPFVHRSEAVSVSCLTLFSFVPVENQSFIFIFFNLCIDETLFYILISAVGQQLWMLPTIALKYENAGQPEHCKYDGMYVWIPHGISCVPNLQ